MSVVARFWARSIEKFAYAKNASGGTGWAEPKPIVKVTLSVVSGGRAPENAEWASATPHGEISMTIGNPDAAAFFNECLEEGADIEVVFRRLPAVESTPPEGA